MEIPERIKEHAIRVAKGTDSWTPANQAKLLLDRQRQDILNMIRDYKENKRRFLGIEKEREEAVKWCKANGIEISNEPTVIGGFDFEEVK